MKTWALNQTKKHLSDQTELNGETDADQRYSAITHAHTTKKDNGIYPHTKRVHSWVKANADLIKS